MSAVSDALREQDEEIPRLNKRLDDLIESGNELRDYAGWSGFIGRYEAIARFDDLVSNITKEREKKR